jgi:hypothetical protein
MDDLKRRIKHLRTTLAQAPLLFAGFSFVYLLVSIVIVLYIHTSFAGFFRGMYLSYTVPYVALTLLLSILFGAVMASFVIKLREIKLHTAGLGATGVIFGALAAGCPGCFFGLFPVVLSLFGITATLAILPFNGLELQALAVLALLVSLYTLSVETEVVCEIKPKKT